MFSSTNMFSMDPESNVDANSLLTELDKGLRSSRIGDECESIVRFPWLFERYPFPILINSACLKLAEVFRNGSNFLRVLILKVMQESEKHLDKIVNIDEFVRRLFSVSYSNDPLARAITLRTLASIARIVATRKNIHHFIRNSLDSNDEVEVNAAIEAAACFAGKCDDFAANMYPKVIVMISGSTTSLETKINLLSVLHHVHYNSSFACDVTLNCVKFLPIYPSEKFVCACLHSLTRIAANSLTQIPQQINLLMKYFSNDTRNNVKSSVLRDLKYLAASSPHLWQKESIAVLVEYILSAQKDSRDIMLCSVLSVINELVNSTCILAGEHDFYEETIAKIAKFCLQVIYSEQQVHLIPTCICILTNLSLNCNSNFDHQIDYNEETCCAIQAFLLSCIESNSKSDSNFAVLSNAHVKKVFKCIVSICQSQKLTLITQIIETLRCVIMNVELNSVWFGSSCEALCAIGSTLRDTNVLFPEDALALITSNCNSIGNYAEPNLIKLYTMYFQAASPTIINDECNNNVMSCLKDKSLWGCFRIIRQAMRYGHHLIASSILEQIKDMEPNENIYFWTISLTCIATAESHLIKCIQIEDMDKNLKTSISLYIEALTYLKASVTPNNAMKFQCEYIKLRLKYLQIHHFFRQCCKLIRTSPPPAIAASTALTTRDDLLKCGNIVIVMRKNAKEFRSLADSYSNLNQSLFNADEHTLAHIQLLQHSCIILAEAIENLFQSNRLNALFVSKDIPFQGDSKFTKISAPLEHQLLIETCNNLSKIIHTDLNNMQSQQSIDPISGKQISVLLSVSSDLLKVPLCIPRFFFQAIQNTCIKLAISPQPKSPGDLLIINSSTHFALRIEGVIVNNKCQSLIRKVGKVLLCVNGVLISRSTINQLNSIDGQLKSNSSDLFLQSIVEPLNDYFQVQFLISLTTPALYSINIETSIIDENEAQWKTGPNLSLSAKVVEDPACK